MTRRVERKVIDDRPQEFPRCDERRLGQPYRYAYSMPLADEGSAFGSKTHLVRHDMQTGARLVHEFGEHRYPGEFVFVPRHEGAAEDEGWLMGYVIDMSRLSTALVIIDAQNFSGKPQAVVTIPHRVPPGFHGNWVPAA